MKNPEKEYREIEWEKLPKPWTFEQCRTRYVYCDDEIGFRKLSKLSGRTLGVLGDWANKIDHPSNEGIKWITARELYKKELRTNTHIKVVNDKSNQLADKLSKTLKEHIHAQEVIRNYIYKLIMIKVKKLAEFEPGKTIEELEREIDRGNYFDSNMEKQIRSFMTVKEGIEKTLGWDLYINPNAAISTLERQGYTISSGEDTEENTEVETIS